MGLVAFSPGLAERYSMNRAVDLWLQKCICPFPVPQRTSVAMTVEAASQRAKSVMGALSAMMAQMRLTVQLKRQHLKLHQKS